MQSTYYLAAIVFVVVGVLILIMVSPLIFSNNRADEGMTTSTKERIDVRARPITVPSPYYGTTITGYHLFIVYIDGAGKQFICEAFPLDPNTGQMPSNSVLLSDPDGLLTRGYCKPHLSGTTAAYISNVASATATTAIKAKEAYDCFVKETVAFNAANIPYRLTTGPNSNSYVRTLLDHCKVPAVKPPTAVLTPGWDISIRFES